MSKFNLALVGGTGAVGLTVAAKLQNFLSKSQNPNKPGLYIVGREGSPAVRALQDVGSITLTDSAEATGKITSVPIDRNQVVTALHQVPGEKFPVFMVKGGKPMDEAVAAMRDDASKHGGRYLGAAVLQNGVGNAEKILATGIIPRENLMYSTLNVASSLQGPGKVKQQNPNYMITLGNPSGSLSPSLQGLYDLFQESGLRVQSSDRIEAKMWIKLMWNTAYNGIAAVYDKTVGAIHTDNNLRRLVRSIMREVQAVAKAKGIEISEEEFWNENTRSDVPAWDSFSPSTLQDKITNRPLEIDPIWQEVVNEATKYQISVPKTTELLEQLRRLDKARTQS